MFGQLFPLAIVAAAYPTLLAMVVVLLAHDNPRRLLTAYVAGGLLISIAAGFAIVAALSSGHVVGGSDHTIGPGVDLAGGLLALFLLWVLLTNRDQGLRERRARKKEEKERESDGRDPLSQRILDRGSVTLTFALALVLNLPGAMYLVALKDIAAADQSTATDVIQILVFNAVMFALAEIPLIGYLVAPEATRERVARFNAWLGRNGRRIAMVLCGAVGVILVIRGIVGLT